MLNRLSIKFSLNNFNNNPLSNHSFDIIFVASLISWATSAELDCRLPNQLSNKKQKNKKKKHKQKPRDRKSVV